MRKKSIKIIKDPIYGFIELNEEFLKIIDHEKFQRLRYIKQLGFTYLVYPSATHSRFEHSLGVFHLTRIFHNINNIKDKELLIAALLHDVGHGPFSHSSEHHLVSYIKENHEKIGYKVSLEILEDLNINFDKRKFKKFYFGNSLGKVITSELGTDRIDYLKRDSYFAGVEFGKVDNERLIRNIIFRNEEILLNEKAIFDAYNLLISRYFMYKTVYMHKIAYLGDEIFGEIIRILVEEESFDPYFLFSLDDGELKFLIKHSNNLRLKELYKILFLRNLPKYYWIFDLEKGLKKEEMEYLKEEIKSLEKNSWIFQIPSFLKTPKIKLENGEELKDSPLMKSLIKEEKSRSKLYIYSCSNIKSLKKIVKTILN